MTVPTHAARTLFDSGRKFVRVTGRRLTGFIEFDFAIGEPEIFVELVLPAAAFEEFCSSNDVTMLEGDRPEEQDSDWSWHMAQAQQQRFR
jgi:phenol hydroxylase P0 protein